MLDTAQDVIRRPGGPLQADLREFFEARFGCDFRAVRIHTDAFAAESARRLNALAYTVHNHIVFAQPEPGLDVLAHELAHVVQQCVVQQSGSAIPDTLQLGEASSGLEEQARRAAWQVLRGDRPRIEARPEARGLVLRMLDVCPGEPAWEVIPAGDQEIYDPANKIIEAAYLFEKADHADSILVGSQFTYGGKLEIQLPRGAPNKAFGNHLLGELRGIVQQLKPDIVDFKERVFYEIKTARDAGAHSAKVRNQLQHYYKLTEAIRQQYGAANEPSWNQVNATWTPPVILPLPGAVGKVFVCTSATNYSIWPPGLVLYDVRKKKKEEDRKRLRIATVQPVARDNDATLLLRSPERVRAAMEDFSPYYPAFVAIAPTRFWQDWQKQMADERMRKTTEMLGAKLPPFLDKRSPIGQLHTLGWALVGISAAAMAAVFWIPVLVEVFAAAGAVEAGSAVATGSAAAAGSAAADAQVVSLAAYRAMRASKAAIELSKAAGVLIVLGLGRQAAAAGPVTVTNESAVRIVPIEDFKPFQSTLADSSVYDVPGDYVFKPSDIDHNFDVGKPVVYDSVQHTVIAQFTVTYAP